MADIPNPPTLAAELYTGLQLSPQRVRFMAVVTVLVCLVTVGMALTSPRKEEATVEVDVAAFAVSGTAAFELQSMADDFLNALVSPAAIRVTAEELDMATTELSAGIVTRREENATRVTVAYADTDVDRATEIARATARNALRELANQRIASATRDVEAARSRVVFATSSLDTFETTHGQRDIPGEHARLTALLDQLITQQAASTTPAATQGAIDDTSARRAELEPFVRDAASLEAERSAAEEQLLDASTRLSQAQSQLGAADSDAVVQPGFSTATSRLPGLVTALASGLVIGIVASYGISWLVQRRRAERQRA